MEHIDDSYYKKESKEKGYWEWLKDGIIICFKYIPLLFSHPSMECVYGIISLCFSTAFLLSFYTIIPIFIICIIWCIASFLLITHALYRLDY